MSGSNGGDVKGRSMGFDGVGTRLGTLSATTVTSFAEDGTIDAGALVSMVDLLAGQGVSVVTANGNTGETCALSTGGPAADLRNARRGARGGGGVSEHPGNAVAASELDRATRRTAEPALLRGRTLAYVESLRSTPPPYGRYRFAASMPEPVLYASTYAAMMRDLYDDLAQLSEPERRAWVDYLNAHQDDDGLYRDPLIYGEGWYRDDPLWCGRPHLTCHVIVALSCLGARPPKPFRWLEQFLGPGQIEAWLASRNWQDRPAWVGNEVMNVGTLLQYSRDTFADEPAGDALTGLLDWLDRHWLDAATGMWGGLDADDPIGRSHLVQAAYHLWPLYAYDRRPIPFADAAIATVLRTQNPLGGFGWGVHNPDDPWRGSACEDIDSIEPLVRFGTRLDRRRDGVIAALRRALPWVLTNQNGDGGFVFVRGRRHDYGHPLLQAEADQSALFPTWFRTLSLAYLGQVLPDTLVGRVPWRFCPCPGYQFWAS
jgi:hypothetical protein